MALGPPFRAHRQLRRAGPILDLVLPAAGGPAAEALGAQPAAADNPLEALSREQARRRLWAEVGRLPARQRAALLLHVQEGLPTGEVAALLGRAEATVRVHLHRALETLRKRMAEVDP
jgi:RNA polymerase sigma factor (sigma-70 family)